MKEYKRLDEIHIYGLEVFCNHGVYKEENALGQKFVIDAVLYTDTKKAGITDCLEDSVNYGSVIRVIEDEMKAVNYKLLEKVADTVALKILEMYPALKAVDFEVKKPWAPVMRHIDYASVKIHRERHKVYVGIGSNIGDKEKYLQDAISSIRSLQGVGILKVASFIETEPYGYVDQDYFMNTVICFTTCMEPEELLKELQRIELEAGRTREIHWGPRTLDLDILLFDQYVMTNPELILPHPEIEKRMFVLESLCEIAPFEVHPLLQKRFITLKEELEHKLQVTE